MGRELVDEIITLIHSESNNNPAPKSCRIIGNYGDDPYSDVEIENLGILLHKKTIGTPEIGLDGIICFLNGDLDDCVVITSTIVEDIDLSPIFNALNDLNSSKSDISHIHSQYLTEHQDLSNYVVKNELNQGLSKKVDSDELIDLIYPIGSIYMSANNVNPAVLFGGTWEQIQDKFLLASGSTYSNGATGGEATHKLTESEMPSHNHTQSAHSHNAQSNALVESNVTPTNSSKRKMSYTSGDYYYPYSNSTISWSRHTATGSATPTIQNKGGGAAHNNMPPYLVINVWKRTA